MKLRPPATLEETSHLNCVILSPLTIGLHSKVKTAFSLCSGALVYDPPAFFPPPIGSPQITQLCANSFFFLGPPPYRIRELFCPLPYFFLPKPSLPPKPLTVVCPSLLRDSLASSPPAWKLRPWRLHLKLQNSINNERDDL